MRVTQNFLYDSFIKRINANRSDSAEIQNRLTTGKRVAKASDDNISFAKSRAIRNSAFKEEQYQKNLSSGLAQARQIQDSMSNVIDLLITIKQTAIQGANDSNSATEREVLAKNVESSRELILNELNTDFNGVYLFGGTNTDVEPFEFNSLVPGLVADNSNGTRLSVQASDSTNLEFSVTGTELRNGPVGDIFVSIRDLQFGLQTNDQASINTTIDEIDAAIDHVVGLASEQGNSMNRMEFLYEQYEKRQISSEKRISELVDADYAETIALFQQYQTSYEAALAVHSESLKTSLLNFL